MTYLVIYRDTGKAIRLDGSEYFYTSDGRRSNFQVHELSCKGIDVILTSQYLIDGLQLIRDYFGKPTTVSSAFRNPAYNDSLAGSVIDSNHQFGDGADVVISGVSQSTLYNFCVNRFPYAYKLGVNSVHFDFRYNKNANEDDNHSDHPEEPDTPVEILRKMVKPEKLEIVQINDYAKNHIGDYQAGINASFSWPQADGGVYATSLLIKDDKAICGTQPNSKPMKVMLYHLSHGLLFLEVLTASELMLELGLGIKWALSYYDMDMVGMLEGNEASDLRSTGRNGFCYMPDYGVFQLFGGTASAQEITDYFKAQDPNVIVGFTDCGSREAWKIYATIKTNNGHKISSLLVEP